MELYLEVYLLLWMTEGCRLLKYRTATHQWATDIPGDSAFVIDVRCTNGKVLRGRKSNEKKGIPQSAVLAAVDILLQRVMPSERQSAEWVSEQ